MRVPTWKRPVCGAARRASWKRATPRGQKDLGGHRGMGGRKSTGFLGQQNYCLVHNGGLMTLHTVCTQRTYATLSRREPRTRQCGLINSDKGTTLLGDTGAGEAVHVWGLEHSGKSPHLPSVLSKSLLK